MLKVVIWGTGSGSAGLPEACLVRDVQIIAYVDNQSEKWGTIYQERTVISPKDIFDIVCDYYIIASIYYEEIEQQLLELGISQEKIIYYNVSQPQKCLSMLGLPKYLLKKGFSLDQGKLNETWEIFKINGFIDKVIEFDKSINPALIRKLIKSYIQAKEHEKSCLAPYQTGANWKSFMELTRKPFYKAMKEQNTDKIAELLQNFFRNCLSTGIMGGEQAFKNSKDNPEVYKEFLHNFKVWTYSINSDCEIQELAMPPVGNPYGFDVEGQLINTNCFWNHYRAHYCNKLLDGQEKSIVAEIGGGYGGFAYYLLKNNQSIAYINFDLPENLLISSYYLSLAYPDKRVLYFNEVKPLTEDLLKDYDIILMPHYMLLQLPDLSVDFFINTISLSEMEYDTICEYISQISRTCKSYFYHENLMEAPVGYSGFPTEVFPKPAYFKEMSRSLSRWIPFDVYSKHSYYECLYIRE